VEGSCARLVEESRCRTYYDTHHNQRIYIDYHVSEKDHVSMSLTNHRRLILPQTKINTPKHIIFSLVHTDRDNFP
jgi:hypothetical protein